MANFFQNKVDFELPKEQKIAVRELLKRGTESPDFPDRQVASADPMQDLAYRLSGQYAESGASGAYQTALSETTKTATQGLDLNTMPEYRALVEQILGYGQGEAQRLQGGSSPWRVGSTTDALGVREAESKQRMLVAAVPFLTQLRAEKQQAVSKLAALDKQGQATTLSKAAASAGAGQQARGMEQEGLEAQYANAMDPLAFRYQTQPEMFNRALGANYTANVEPSGYQKWTLALGSILGGMRGMSEGGYKLQGNANNFMGAR